MGCEVSTLSTRTTNDLIAALDYQCTPGAHTISEGDCGHWCRGGRVCRYCLDAELLSRGTDVTNGGFRYAYVREDGRVARKTK